VCIGSRQVGAIFGSRQLGAVIFGICQLGARHRKPLSQRIYHIIYLVSTIYFISRMSESKTHVPKLEADNYYAWSYRMEMRLRKLGVWSIVNGQEPRPLGSGNSKAVKGWVTRMELALNEIVSGVGDSQLVHTRVSMDPSVVWERLESIYMSQGLGSIISMWQRFFQLKKSEEVTIQTHAASIREYADRLTGLGDSPSESLMVAVLLFSLPESYGPLIVSLDTHPDCTKFDFVVQRCINEEARQLSISSSKQSSSQISAFNADSKPKKDKKDVTCYRCKKKGHYKNECKEILEETQDSEKGKATVVAAAASDKGDLEW
jgi:hypothetical protein